MSHQLPSPLWIQRIQRMSPDQVCRTLAHRNVNYQCRECAQGTYVALTHPEDPGVIALFSLPVSQSNQHGIFVYEVCNLCGHTRSFNGHTVSLLAAEILEDIE